MSLPIGPQVGQLMPQGGGRSSRRRRSGSDHDAQASPAGARILVVEDEWLVAMEIESVLAAAGYRVIGPTGRAAEAVRLAERERPDLALMDIRLGRGDDGVAVAHELRERFDVPSLYASAHADPATVERARVARPAGWLPKPFSQDQLLAAVADALKDRVRS
jgi:two-component system, response regulator PdtaR